MSELYIDRKKRIAISETQNLLSSLSRENPTKNFVGLPSYHLNRIAIDIKENPSWLLEQALSSQENFLELNKKFETEFVLEEFKAFEKETDSYKQDRIISSIVRAYVRANLNLDSTLININDNLVEKIVPQVIHYRFGFEEFDGLKASDLFTVKP